MNPWKDKSVLVTGATGLVGSHLVAKLVNLGAHVTALVRDFTPQSELMRSGMINRIEVVSGSLEDLPTSLRAIASHNIEVVFHLGAQAIVGAAQKAPFDTFESNIKGTYCLLEACRQVGGLESIVVASSDKAYGKSAVLPYTEEMPPIGKHPYDVSKSCADLIAQSYHASFDLPVVIARCGNIFGGGDLNWSRIIPHTIRSLHMGASPQIRSNGKFTRDYIYIEDVVSAYLQLAEKVNFPGVVGEAFNFAPSIPQTVLEVVQTIQSLMGAEHIQADVLDIAKGEIPDQYLCCKKAQQILGWRPEYDLESGLKETVKWYRDYLGAACLTAPL